MEILTRLQLFCTTVVSTNERLHKVMLLSIGSHIYFLQQSVHQNLQIADNVNFFGAIFPNLPEISIYKLRLIC